MTDILDTLKACACWFTHHLWQPQHDAKGRHWGIHKCSRCGKEVHVDET